MRALVGVVLLPLISGCALLPARVPDGAYYPNPAEPSTAALSQTLWRAARAAGDDPTRYSFARLETDTVAALAADETIFYFSDGLARLPAPQRDALVAQAVAHEVLGHEGHRRALSIGVSAGFTALGFVVPGLGLADLVVNPLVVRAFAREQHLTADQKAVEILRAMGHPAPRQTLATALRAAARINGPTDDGLLAAEPPLTHRLAALEPLEPPTELAATLPADPAPR